MTRQVLLAAVLCTVSGLAGAQMPIPEAAAPDGATLFKRQCGTCHTVSATEPARQGPHLAGVVGRPIGSVPGYKYTAGYSTAGANWDEERLDRYLTNPQAMFPGSSMLYKQANAGVRKSIIDYLKDQH
ncbi:MAG: c-type cytochrome [Acetobacteraceae bacterium]